MRLGSVIGAVELEHAAVGARDPAAGAGAGEVGRVGVRLVRPEADLPRVGVTPVEAEREACRGDPPCQAAAVSARASGSVIALL